MINIDDIFMAYGDVMKYGLPGIIEINLNTVNNPAHGFMDETERIQCSACGNYLLLGQGWPPNPVQNLLTAKHMEFCEGELGATLIKIQDWYRNGGDQEIKAALESRNDKKI